MKDRRWGCSIRRRENLFLPGCIHAAGYPILPDSLGDRRSLGEIRAKVSWQWTLIAHAKLTSLLLLLSFNEKLSVRA